MRGGPLTQQTLRRTREPPCRAQVGAMSFQSYEKMWKAYVDVFTAYLLTSDQMVGTAEDLSPASQRLNQLGRETGSLRTIMCFAHPTRYIGYNYGMGQVSVQTPCVAQDVVDQLNMPHACHGQCPYSGIKPPKQRTALCKASLNRASDVARSLFRGYRPCFGRTLAESHQPLWRARREVSLARSPGLDAFARAQDVVHGESISERHCAIVPHLQLMSEQRGHLVALRAAYLVRSAQV